MLVTLQETADGINKMQSKKFTHMTVEANCDSQGTNSKYTFEVGSRPRIPRQITILPEETTSKELPHGPLKVTGLRNG